MPKRAFTAQNSNFLIQNLNINAFQPQTSHKGASAKYGHRGRFHKREKREKQWKPVILAPKGVVTAQIQASVCITNLKHYICEAAAK